MSAPELVPLEFAAPAPPPGKPWGFWATVGMSLVILFVWIVGQVVVTLLYLALAPSAANQTLTLPDGTSIPVFESGTLLSIATLVTALIAAPLCVLFARLKSGISVKDYLGLRAVPLGQLARWLGLTVLICAASDTLTWFLGRPVVPDFMLRAESTVVFEPLLWVAVIFGAPLFEEFFFRGFLFAGLRNTRLGNIGTVLLTTAAWASLHLQYDLYQLALLFVAGLTLAIARIRTNSLAVPFAMHALNNLIAALEASIYLHFLK
jgi:uncharacterized protein